MERAANFSRTGNIECVADGRRVAIGQYASGGEHGDGQFRLHKRFAEDRAAMRRVEQCRATVLRHGRPNPTTVWVD